MWVDILLAHWPTQNSRLLAFEQPKSSPHQGPGIEGLLVAPGFVDGGGRPVRRCQASAFRIPPAHTLVVDLFT